jgi:hypothetical protein
MKLPMCCRTKTAVKRTEPANVHRKHAQEHAGDAGGNSTAATPKSNSAAALRSSHETGGAGYAGPGTDRSGEAADMNARTGNTAETSRIPGNAQIEADKDAVKRRRDVGDPSVAVVGSLPKHAIATASAKSGCLGLEYDSDDDSDEDG